MKTIQKLILLAFALSGLAQAQGLCSLVAAANPTSGTTVVVAAGANALIFCQLQIQIVQGVTPANYSVVHGTGSTCATSRVSLTPVWAGTASTTDHYWFKSEAPITIPRGSNICLILSATPTSSAVSVNYRD